MRRVSLTAPVNLSETYLLGSAVALSHLLEHGADLVAALSFGLCTGSEGCADFRVKKPDALLSRYGVSGSRLASRR